jgi:hypothetical protein
VQKDFCNNIGTDETNVRSWQKGAARTIGQRIMTLNASSVDEISSAFEHLSQRRPGAILVAADPFFISRRNMSQCRAMSASGRS